MPHGKQVYSFAQLKNVDNNPTTLQTVGVHDISEQSYQEMALETKIVYSGNPGAATKFPLWWAFTNDTEISAAAGIADIGGSGSAGVNWQSYPIALTSGAGVSAVEYFRTVLFSPAGLRLHVAYTVSDLTNALTTVDVTLYNNRGGAV
jgi:hypothetical protein